MDTVKIAFPEWTEYRKKNGLDPLGMQNGSINLYQRLLPGLSNVTLRVRYYGLYAWLAAVYAREFRNTDLASWQQFVRRAEALYALVNQYRGGEAGVAGVQWAARKLGSSEPKLGFAANADPGGELEPYLQQDWGVYGAAYGSQLLEIGVFAQVETHPIPVPSVELGDALAEAFADAIGDLADIYLACLDRGAVSLDELGALAPMTPSGIVPASRECQLYEDMLFARALARPADLARRETLLLVLNAAAHFNRLPDVGSLRWLMYAGADEQGHQLELQDAELERQRLRWWVYQANDLLHFAYETLLKFVLDTLANYPSGLTLGTLIGECVSEIAEAAPDWPSSWSAFSAANVPEVNASSLQEKGSERALMEVARVGAGSRKCTAECAWAALKLLATVQNRIRDGMETVLGELGGLDQEAFHSLITETAFLARVSDDDFTGAVARIIEERIVKRHLWVAHRKFRYQGDYTFLIEADDGRVRLRAVSGPVLTNPRLGPAVTFLRDIHLIDERGITDRGRQLGEVL